ncbi:putative transcription factor [Cardamine amara subsp. amara]|uniref:Transcription factor n=1 Tax=Cardamine amara subsp. amara TaxID=228776 RepID=A0ABD1C6A3_CARAN
MTKRHHKLFQDLPSPSSSYDEEVEISSESEYNEEKTIFSSEEDEPIDLPPIPVTEKMKRQDEGTSTDVNPKRAKKIASAEGTKSHPSIPRIWSEDDEILVLQGIIDFEKETGKSVFEDTKGFHKVVRKSISFEVSFAQFLDKIRNMKYKFLRKLQNGVQQLSLKRHAHKCFILSKVIWGAEEMALEYYVKSTGEPKKSQGRKKKKVDLWSSPYRKKIEEDNVSKVLIHGGDLTNSDWFDNSFLVRSIENLGVNSVKDKWIVVPIETKKKIEDKLKLLQVKEVECQKIEKMLKTKEVECVRQRSDLLNEVISVLTYPK